MAILWAAHVANNPIRSRRICRPDGTILMVPLDHGVSLGPTAGLEDPRQALEAVAGVATCVTLHKGLVPLAAAFADRLGILLHLSASTDGAPDPHDKRLVATVAEAARFGCDGVSIHVNVGSATEARQLAEAGAVATACQEHGMPLVAMMYPRGPKVPDPPDPARVSHAARLGAELGADAVKVPYTGSPASFRPVVAGCPVPVIVAGGPRRADFAAFLADMRGAREAGARGISVGRNVFQAPHPERAMAELARVFP
jgi:predicted phospho-2-dehydro-3-deoxyheptonate aldolase